MKKTFIAAALCFMLALTARAQFTISNQTIQIPNGVTNNWSGTYNVGNSSNAWDKLEIINGGVLLSDAGAVGPSLGQGSNSALVTGAGSVWSNSTTVGLTIGGAAADNSLEIRAQGKVFSYIGTVGDASQTSNNSVLVTGSGSVWNISDDLTIGRLALNNSLVITNAGAVLVGGIGYIGNSSFNSVLVTGVGSVWSSSNAQLYVGNSGAGNSLEIRDQGKVFDPLGFIGWQTAASNNSVLVTEGSVWNNGGTLTIGGGGDGNRLVITGQGIVVCSNAELGASNTSQSNSVSVSGSGSVWTNKGYLHVGEDGSGNSLVISNQGKVINGIGSIGQSFFLANGNSVLVTDTGSVWSNSSDLYVGNIGFGNSLVISNHGAVINNNAYVGNSSTASNNSVRVVDVAVWRNSILYVGNQGRSNSLVVAGGSVYATNLIIGVASATCDNLVRLDSGDITVTNAAGTATLEVRRGVFILNGGTLRTDKLLVTNGCARFIRAGGTLIAGTIVLDPNADADGDGLLNGWEQAHGFDPFDPTGNNGANGDPDGDGLPNYWEQMYGLDPQSNVGINGANGDPDGDGCNNLCEFLAGSNPVADIKSIKRESNNIRVTWQAAAAKTNALQRSPGRNGSYSNNFADVFIVTNNIGSVTNYLDTGAATNFPSRYYRIRLVP